MPMNRRPIEKIRTESIRVTATPSEHEELHIAAAKAGMALSVFIRVKALEAARKTENRAA